MNPIKKINLEQGVAGEKKLLKLLREEFDDRLFKSSNQYDVFDFYGRHTIVELKCRNISKDTYPTTMIGWNKIKECENPIKICGRKIYFVFEFTEGLYYWRYNKKKVDRYKKEFTGTMKRGCDERKDHLLIPIEDLKVIEEY